MAKAADGVVYRSNVRIERVAGPFRRAWLPAQETPVEFGVHGDVAQHYGVDPDIERPTTLDYVMAAAAGWLTGTLGGALEARGIDASAGRLIAEAAGEIEKNDGVLIIRRIHVRYQLQISAGQEDAAERVHRIHASSCPVYRSISGCIQITTELVTTTL